MIQHARSRSRAKARMAWTCLLALCASAGYGARAAGQGAGAVLEHRARFAAVDVASPAVFVVRVYYGDPAEIGLLADFDLFEYNNREEHYVLVGVDEESYPRLQRLGMRLVIDEVATADLNRAAASPATERAGIPGFPCYRTVEETFAYAQQVVAERPALASWIDFGDSWEKQQGIGGHDMRVLRLTNSAVPGPKPKLILTCSIHAREYTPAELCARFADFLAKNHGRDADATWLLDSQEVHVVLHANPDGRKKAETGLSWRKNTNQSYCGPTSNNRGADLNRNFSFEWNCCGGSSNSQCSLTYHGPSAASEPEVQSIQNYLLAQFPDQRDEPEGAPAPLTANGVYIDVHSYSELVLWPWGWDTPAPNSTQLQTLGRKFAYFNHHTPQQAVDLYVTDGTTIDFVYGNLGVAAYVFELGTAFFQDCATFENQILPDNMQALMYAAKATRSPYMSPAGPDALSVIANPGVVQPGMPLTLSATINDTRYNNTNGTEPVQNIAAAEYYIDTPPWGTGGSPVALPMGPIDGNFGSPVEGASASVATAGLADGRHTLFVRGQDSAGNWGTVSATFVQVMDADADGDGVGNSTDCAPSSPLLWAAPSPARDLLLSKQPADNVSWTPPAQPGATSWVYDVLRSGAADDFAAADCVASGTGATAATDGSAPDLDTLYAYLVRVRNGCGENMGADSGGLPHTGAACP